MTILTRPIKRAYTMEDEAMQTRAETMHGNLVQDLADFTARFPWIVAAWADSFLSDINTSKNFIADTSVQATIKVLTEDVEASMNEGRVALSTLNHYAIEAFPTSPARQRIFGQDTWDKAYGDQEKMQKALRSAHSFANMAEYKAPLITTGYTQAEIDALETLADNIELKDRLQEHAKSGRTVTTEDRIKVNNIVFARMRTISNCAQVVYRTNPAKRALYLLYPQTGEGSNPITVEVDVAESTIVNIPAPQGVVFSSGLIIKMAVSAVAAGGARIYFAGGAIIPPGPADPFMEVQATEENTGEAETDMGYEAGSKTFLNVQNTGMVPVHCVVTFYM